MNDKKKFRQAVLQARRARKASTEATDKATELEERKQVFGANVYVQSSRPTATGPWIWIDTTGIDEIE